jgi:hypothetical protein
MPRPSHGVRHAPDVGSGLRVWLSARARVGQRPEASRRARPMRIRTAADRKTLEAGATMTGYKDSANERLAADLTDLAVPHVDRAVSDLLQYVELPTQLV